MPQASDIENGLKEYPAEIPTCKEAYETSKIFNHIGRKVRDTGIAEPVPQPSLDKTLEIIKKRAEAGKAKVVSAVTPANATTYYGHTASN
ncbi:hypothetical protein BGZ82_006045 [Podila clonocystis]|nr:hypothetical protein BGZ82_006045 [Podila clonocystis]